MTLSAKIRHNWPNARSPEYFIATDTELLYWNQATLGTRPTIAEIEAVELPPPAPIRKLAPYDFQARFTDAELVAIQTSIDPLIIRGRTMLQTIVTFVDLDDPQTQQLVGYMQMIGLLTAERAAEILA